MEVQTQAEAEPRNALAPTGPRTPTGKARAARNSLKHGLLSKDVLIRGESRSKLNAFREGMMADLKPEGEVERLLADRVVASAWRLRRANRLERDVVEQLLDRQDAYRHRSGGRFGGRFQFTTHQVAAHTVHSSDTFGKLSRYEAHIERSMYRALHELQRLQAARRGKDVTPPLTVDVDAHDARIREAPVTIDVPAAAQDDA